MAGPSNCLGTEEPCCHCGVPYALHGIPGLPAATYYALDWLNNSDHHWTPWAARVHLQGFPCQTRKKRVA